MSSYLPRAELTRLLPTGHGFTTDEQDDFIEQGSSDVDGELAHLYWVPFTDYAAGPPVVTPPWQVREAASYFAAFHAYETLGITNPLDDAALPMRMYDIARKILEPFRDAKQQLPPETAYDQFDVTSAWGDGDPYDSNTIALSVTRGEVILDSVRVLTSAGAVTDYQLGSDFYVEYHAPTRKWLFHRIDSAICSQAGGEGDPGDKVYYEVTRIKRHEVVQPIRRSIEIVRG